jgi:hypothetical protein
MLANVGFFRVFIAGGFFYICDFWWYRRDRD